MGIIRRVNSVITAQLNEIVDSFERPEQMLKQAIREMESALSSATESTARAIAGEKRLRHQLALCEKQSQLWQSRATQCLKDGDEAAARRALSRKIERDHLTSELTEQVAAAEEIGGRLRRRLDSMRARLGEARRSLTLLSVRQRSADAQTRFAKALGQFESDTETFDRFDELSQRVAQAEAEAEAIGELRDIECDDLSCDARIEEELRAMKETQQRPAEFA